MTNINCSENCVYQQEGKCSLENIEHQKINFKHSSCAYFVESTSLPFSSTNLNSSH